MKEWVHCEECGKRMTEDEAGWLYEDGDINKDYKMLCSDCYDKEVNNASSK